MGSIIKSRRPAVTFYSSGKISVTSWTMKALGLEPGDAINLWEEGSEVYLYGIKNPAGNCKATLRCNNNASRHTCRCYSSELAHYILHRMGGDKCSIAAANVVDIPIGKGLQLILRHIC
jgi:hypothetical protein